MRTLKTLTVLAAGLLAATLSYSAGANGAPPSTNPEITPKPKLGDVNKDFVVNTLDLIEVLASWGECPTDACAADINFDKNVDNSDLKIVLLNWEG